MPIFNVPVTIQIEAKSPLEASQAVLSFLEYAQDVGNDDDAVKNSLVAVESEITVAE